MKAQFFDTVLELMEQNKDVFFISAGLGWPRTDELAEKFPDRYIQTEASEQSACDLAVGLSYSGKVPIVYTITPFYWRAAETLRTYFGHEKLPVVLVGVGRDEDYSAHDGYSHDAKDDRKLMEAAGIEMLWRPENTEIMRLALKEAVTNGRSNYINIPR